MKYITDATGRFSQRPFYKPEELDFECEKRITDFLAKLHGRASYPIDTEDVIKLIERDVVDLNVYDDLTPEGEGVEGVTYFVRGEKPRVKIDRRLAETPGLVNRYRTTLTHEYGHVFLHGYLFQADDAQGRLKANPPGGKNSCHRDSMVLAQESDWMEWQAGYACGALLMPLSALKAVVGSALAETKVGPPISIGAPEGTALVAKVTSNFQVSEDAARVRLTKLGFLTMASLPGSLFRPPDR